MESVTLSDPAEDALGFQRWLRPQRSAPRALDLYTPRGCGQAAGGPQGATAARLPPTPPTAGPLNTMQAPSRNEGNYQCHCWSMHT